MGVPGLWQALNSVEQKSAIGLLSKEKATFRLAIDVSIWVYQCKSASGGSQPVLRTFFYRLCRLLNAGVRAIFVFDGPQKPAVKRGRQTSHFVIDNTLLRELIELFGFLTWQAPGEAEAECASFQNLDLVDAVLSNDVDSLLFGARTLCKNWSKTKRQDSTARHEIDHTSIFYMREIEAELRLDRQGLILVALLAGGDYSSTGCPGCGILTAVEIARAGYAKTLFANLKTPEAWRSALNDDLHTNSKKNFSRRRPALRIPDTFPDLSIVDLYISPVISGKDELRQYLNVHPWLMRPSYDKIRSFTTKHFAWDETTDAARFVKLFARPAFMFDLQSSEFDADIDGTLSIHASRRHRSADNHEELQISYCPQDLIQLSMESDAQDISFADDVLPEEDLVFRDEISYVEPIEALPLTRDGHGLRMKMWILESLLIPRYDAKIRAWRDSLIKHSAKVSKSKQISRGQTTLDRFFKTTKQIALTTKDRPESVSSKQSSEPSEAYDGVSVDVRVGHSDASTRAGLYSPKTTDHGSIVDLVEYDASSQQLKAVSITAAFGRETRSTPPLERTSSDNSSLKPSTRIPSIVVDRKNGTWSYRKNSGRRMSDPTDSAVSSQQVIDLT